MWYVILKHAGNGETPYWVRVSGVGQDFDGAVQAMELLGRQFPYNVYDLLFLPD